VVFASTNAAVAKAMAVLGSTEVKIDPIKEGVMCEFWIDDDGTLKTEVNEFEPPKTVWSRAGTYEYGTGAWFPEDRSRPAGTWRPQGTQAAASSTPSTPTRSSTAVVRGWDIGREGYVVRVKDEVVFVPNDVTYASWQGTLTHFGGRTGWCFVEVELDWGMRDELALPVCQLMPADVFHGKSNRAPERADAIALPPVKVESEIEENDKALDDFYMPKTLQELVDAIEEIFGAEALDLLPIQWEADPTLYDIDEEREDVIDVMEVSD
jgi:hypothetical protein